MGYSFGIFIWDIHLGYSFGIFIWDIHLGYSFGIFIWDIHLDRECTALQGNLCSPLQELWKSLRIPLDNGKVSRREMSNISGIE
jgi:hypothetical protein